MISGRAVVARVHEALGGRTRITRCGARRVFDKQSEAGGHFFSRRLALYAAHTSHGR